MWCIPFFIAWWAVYFTNCLRSLFISGVQHTLGFLIRDIVLFAILCLYGSLFWFSAWKLKMLGSSQYGSDVLFKNNWIICRTACRNLFILEKIWNIFFHNSNCIKQEGSIFPTVSFNAFFQAERIWNFFFQ